MTERIPSDNEKFYDAEIAPAMAKIMEQCRARGMSLFADVEFDPGHFGRSVWMSGSASLLMHMLVMLSSSAGNIDGFMIRLKAFCHANKIDTSGSIFLRDRQKEAHPGLFH